MLCKHAHAGWVAVKGSDFEDRDPRTAGAPMSDRQTPASSGCEAFCDENNEVEICDGSLMCAACSFCTDEKLPCASWCNAFTCVDAHCAGCKTAGCERPPPSPGLPALRVQSPLPPFPPPPARSPPPPPKPPTVCWWCDPPPPSPQPPPPPPSPVPVPEQPPQTALLGTPPAMRPATGDGLDINGIRLDPLRALVIGGGAALILALGLRICQVIVRIREGRRTPDIEMGGASDCGEPKRFPGRSNARRKKQTSGHHMLQEEDEAEEEEREEFRTARSAPSWAGSANSASTRSDKAAPWNDPPSWAEDEPPLPPREPMPTMPVLEATLYDTLGVAPSASQSEIKRAYHRLSKQLHPDKNPGNKEESERMFHAVRYALRINACSQRSAALLIDPSVP